MSRETPVKTYLKLLRIYLHILYTNFISSTIGINGRLRLKRHCLSQDAAATRGNLHLGLFQRPVSRPFARLSFVDYNCPGMAQDLRSQCLPSNFREDIAMASTPLNVTMQVAVLAPSRRPTAADPCATVSHERGQQICEQRCRTKCIIMLF